jgi:thioredoxin 1
MSDADDSDELDAIRERKKEELRQQLGSTSADEPVHVESADHFQEVTGDGVVLVDFYADWCGPCKMLEPTVEAIAAETPATVAKVDIDQHQQLAQQYNVQGVPTLHLFVDGESTEQLVGVQDRGRLESLIGRHT